MSFSELMAGLIFFCATFRQFIPEEFLGHIHTFLNKLLVYLYPYINITINERQEDNWGERTNEYVYIERYLSTHSSKNVKNLKANFVRGCKSVFLSIDDYQEVSDEFNGVKVWWTSGKTTAQRQQSYYKLTCKRKHLDFVTNVYMKHVRDEGKAIGVRTRQRKLYTNNRSDSWYRWSHIIFKHPSTFDTLAMDPKKKKEILNDLMTFTRSKDYYKKVGKSWKRGYLLYGPPGTGKSSLIAAMANLLEYDIYDLELSSVEDNADLRKQLIDTTSKSIIVIEDIDCSLDLTGQRKEKKESDDWGTEKWEGDEGGKKKKKQWNGSEVTLSGLLNFIDGLWSDCDSERLIVFTTNHVEKLDPALIRRGRMDMHIELSYCCFEAFKVLAKNYLDIESHELFPTIGRLLEETKMTPADVAENLMPKSDEDNVESCLNKLIKSLEGAKEGERLKAVEEEKMVKKSERNGVKGK